MRQQGLWTFATLVNQPLANLPKGFTYLESLITLGIISILVSLAIPSMSHLLDKTDGDLAMDDLRRQLQYAREQALAKNQNLTLCGTVNQKTCVPTAFDYTMLFHDKNRNKRIDADEEMLSVFNRPNYRGYIHWNVNGIVYRDNGSANSGSIVYCPRKSDATGIRRLTVNFAGRAYIAKPNKKGIVTSASGKKITC